MFSVSVDYRHIRICGDAPSLPLSALIKYIRKFFQERFHPSGNRPYPAAYAPEMVQVITITCFEYEHRCTLPLRLCPPDRKYPG